MKQLIQVLTLLLVLGVTFGCKNSRHDSSLANNDSANHENISERSLLIQYIKDQIAIHQNLGREVKKRLIEILESNPNEITIYRSEFHRREVSAALTTLNREMKKFAAMTAQKKDRGVFDFFVLPEAEIRREEMLQNKYWNAAMKQLEKLRALGANPKRLDLLRKHLSLMSERDAETGWTNLANVYEDSLNTGFTVGAVGVTGLWLFPHLSNIDLEVRITACIIAFGVDAISIYGASKFFGDRPNPVMKPFTDLFDREAQSGL